MTSGQVHTRPDSNSGKQKTILLLLAVVALGSVFLLPRFVSEPWIEDSSVDGTPVADSSPSSVKPSTAAEKTRYRQDSQSVLAQIIPVRDRLVEQSVEFWSPVEFQLAMDKIEAGDERYSYGEYRDALDIYQQALDEFVAIETLGQEKLKDALITGNDALESLNVVVATESSELASMISPQGQDVQALAKRVETLEDLAVQLEAGDLARQSGNLNAARDAYQNAVGIDDKNNRAADSLAAINQEITDSRFRQHMSRAYAAMESKDFESALLAFEQAETIYPGHDAIAQGRAQVANRSSQDSVSAQINHAAELESQEEWSQAVSVYESLLEQDPTLTDAKVRLIPSRVRADLDQRLVDLMEDPVRLASPSVFRQAQAALNDAKGIQGPGSRLSGQIEELQTLLERALTPVNVVFQSDNTTTVTLFRVAQLGQFSETSLTLKPGRYIVGGTRQGYRDVRVEFTVTGEPLDGPIVVRCEESI
jgi:tetratricopeptide (TPR) repeat protein